MSNRMASRGLALRAVATLRSGGGEVREPMRTPAGSSRRPVVHGRSRPERPRVFGVEERPYPAFTENALGFLLFLSRKKLRKDLPAPDLQRLVVETVWSRPLAHHIDKVVCAGKILCGKSRDEDVLPADLLWLDARGGGDDLSGVVQELH